MKKALIVTLFGNYNYGNKFQNYAMQEILKRYGLDVFTLNTEKINSSTFCKVSYKSKIKNISLKNIYRKLIIIYNRKINKKRTSAFEKFSKQYIKLTESISDEKLKEDFDFVCIGSDQVWKPRALNSYYAYGFFHNSDNVFSYAPSFGVSNISAECVDEVKDGLNNLQSISVREQRGAEIIKEMIHKDVDVLVDPTMLLTTDKWDSILKEPLKVPKKGFVMTYFLGNYSKKRKRYIKQFAKKNHLEIIDLGQVNFRKYYCTDPAEFLYFIKNAKMIFTDSFHGTVFSILYGKPFYVMKREDELESMSSRIETLLDKFGLQDRVVNNYNQQVNFDIDLKNRDELLEKERKKSDEYLKKALGIKEN